MHDSIVVSLVYSIYNTIREPGRWGQILKECEELVGAESCGIAAYNFAGPSGEIVAHSGYHRDDYVDLYENRYSALDPWLRRQHPYTIENAIWVGRELCPHSELIRTEFFNDWLQPQDLFHRISCNICHDRDGAVYFIAFRKRTGKKFERHDLQPIQPLIPHLRQVFELQQQLGGSRPSKPRPLLDIAHRVHDAVLIVGAGGKVLGSNSAGARMLARDRNAASEFGLWSRITAALDSSDENGISPLPGNIDNNGYSISIFPLPEGASASQRDPAVAVIGREIPRDGDPREEQAQNKGVHWRPLVIRGDNGVEGLDESGEAQSGDTARMPDLPLALREPETKAETNETRLHRLYDFTHSESRLAILLACGHSLRDCADVLGVSISTVRTHLQRIFHKTDTHHQGQLVATLIAGPAKLSIECVTLPGGETRGDIA